MNVNECSGETWNIPTRRSPEITQEERDAEIFMHKSAMQLHAREVHRSEVKPHQCQQCLKSFSSNHQLVQHIRVHTGEKPYKCSYCDRRFKQLSHVQQHTRLHTGERPYKCHYPECGRAFIQLSNLQQHLRNHDSQIERMKNRPFHCQICGKGFATESSLRTHTTKHAALIGGPNAVNCPLCHKMYLGGAALMEHMKHVHKDPNASGVAAKRRTPNHPCPVCGKQYVNEGSLRKHMATHPEAAGLASSLRMWPCSVCQAVFTHESAFLTHMDHMRMDPKHQFAAQYVLSRAAAERRERETLFAAAAAASSMGINGHMFGGMSMAAMNPMSAPLVTAASAASPSALSDSSRISTPAEPKLEPRLASGGLLQHGPQTAGDAGGDMERPDSMLGHVQQRMEVAASSRLSMLNRLGMQHVAGMGSPLAPSTQQQHQQQHQAQQQTQHQHHQHHQQQHHQQHPQLDQQQQQQHAPPRPGDSMRAMIQQTQAELVKSTLSSQAESARSLDVLRSLNTQAESMVGQADLRMFQADLAIRSSHELYGQQAAPQPGDALSAAADPFRLTDPLRVSHDPRAALGGYLAGAQQN